MARNFLINTTAHVLIAAFALATTATAAAAQPAPCAPRAAMVEWLAENFAEQPVAFGLIGNHQLLEIHVSETGSWTAVITNVTGTSCMVSAGHSWTPVEQPVEGASDAKDAN